MGRTDGACADGGDGGSASICDYPVSGAQAKQSAIGGTLTLAYEIGRTLFEAKQQKLNPVRELLTKLNGHALFHGKAVDIRRRMDGGFTRGEAVFEGTGENKGKTMRLFSRMSSCSLPLMINRWRLRLT